MNYSVLIVEDSAILRAVVRRAVEQAGVGRDAVREAANGQEALDVMRTSMPDLVLLDLNMPIMDGVEFVERKTSLGGDSAAVPVVVVTTDGNKKKLQRLTDLGVSGFLRKPFEPEELRAVVRGLMAR